MIKTLLSTLRRNWLTGLILALLLVGSGGAWAQSVASYVTARTTGTAYGFNLTSLLSSTTCYARIAAVTEANSPALAGSQATPAGFAFGPGPYTIDNSMATGSTNFANFTDAINALNTGTVTGPLTFNVAANATPYVELPPSITKSGSAGNLITFQRAPTATSNPLILSPTNTGAGTTDYIVRISGADYLVFDGIDLSDVNSTAGTTAQQREWGYCIAPASTTDGAQNNAIRNCVITLNGGASTTPNTGSCGILLLDNALVAANATTAPNSGNKFNGNTINGPVIGIYIAGTSTTVAANQDAGNEIGSTAGNTINAKSGTASGYGVRVEYASGTKTENNVISLIGTTGTSTLRGVGYGASAGTGINGAVLINNNTITLSTAGTGTVWGINQAGTSTPTSVAITNNKVQNSTLTGATGTVNGIEDGYNLSSGTSTITGNQVTGNSATTTGVVSWIYRSGTAGTVNMNGNYIGVTSVGAASANTLTGASGTLYNLRATTGTITVSNNVVQNSSFTNTSGTTASTLYGYSNSGSPVSETITGNTFTNMSIGGANTAATNIMAGLLTNTISTAVKAISGNTIGGFTLGTAAGTMSGTVTGISQSLGTTIGINQNKIYNLTAYGTAGVITGIALNSGTTLNVANNMIGSLTAPAATGLLAVSGITAAGGTTANVYHNSVYLNATGGATFGTSGIYLSSTSTALDLRGNIVVNASASAGTGGSAAALRRVSGTAATVPANYATTSNNNLFYAGTPSATNLIYVEGTTTATNAQQTLAAYKTFMGNRDQVSVTENPTFASTDGTTLPFLHISPGTATQVESGGASTAVVALDYDNQSRGPYPLASQANGGGTASDIGGDEGDFTPSDQSPPTITYTALGNTGSTANRTLTATITDASGIATGTGAPRLYYRKQTGGVGVPTAYVSVIATSTSVAGNGNGTYTYTFDYSNPTIGGVAVADVVQYYVAAQDASASNNMVTSPSGGTGISPPGSTAPSAPNAYTIVPSLAGTYYVGTGTACGTPTYATLTAAAAAYNATVLAGPVTFVLVDNTYAGETYPIAFNANPDASATNTLTIKPCSSATPAFSGSNAGPLLRLNGASYVTLDGSNNGTSSQNWSLTNTSTSTSASLVQLGSNATGVVPANATVKNLVLTGAPSITTFTANYGIQLAVTSPATTGASNNTFQNNAITKVQVGISAVGLSTTVRDVNTTITNNQIGSATAAAGFGGATALGITASNQTTLTITGNVVRNPVIVAAGANPIGATALISSTMLIGIDLSSNVATATVSNNTVRDLLTSGGSGATTPLAGVRLGTAVISATVNANLVTNLKTTSTAGYGGYGIYVNTATASVNNVLSNNMISDINGSNFSAFGNSSSAGIYLNSTQSGISVVFNSVNMYGTSTYSSAVNTAALAVETGSTGLTVRNNVLMNSLVGSTALSLPLSLYSNAPASAYTVINNNDYYSTGSQATSPVMFSMGGTNGTTLAALRTATTQDLASISADPSFTLPNDLHAGALALDGAAASIAGITTDIDGQSRNATTPDIGADEFTLVTIDLKPLALNTPTTTQGCYGTAETVTVTVKNQGVNTLDFSLNPATVTATVTGAATATLTGTLNSGTLAPNATQIVTLAPTLNMSATGAYTFAISATVTGDQNTTNDALTPNPVITTVAPVAGTLSPASAAICQSGTASLVLAGAANGTIQYQSSPDGTTFTDISGATSAAYTTPVLTSTTFFRAQTRCGVNSATSNVATITVNNPLITGTNTPVVICPSSSAALTATANAGSTIRWYDTNASTTVLATGGAYATPVLTASRQYFVVAVVSNGSTNTTGLPSNAATYGTYSQSTLTDYPLGFKVTQAGTLASVDVYPTAVGALTIRLYATASQPAAAGAQVGSDVTITVTAAQVATKVTIPLSISLAVGDYKLTNTVGAVGRFSTYSGAYPLSSGPISVLGSYFASSSTTFSNISYNSFFNLAFTTDCASARTAVQVNVTPIATANAGTAPAGVCAGSTYPTTGSFGGSATSATYTSSGSGAFSNAGVINGTTTSVTYSPSTADITAGSVTLMLTTSGPCTAATSTLLLTTSSTTYTGAAAGDGNNWFNAANWTACVPGSTVDALIPTGLANYPILSTTATAEVRSLTLNNGASLAQSAGTLNVYGNLTSSTPAANVALTGGNVAFVGPMPTVTGLGSLYNLTVSLNSAAGTLTLANNVTVTHALTLTQGTLTTDPYAVALAPSATATETDASYVLGQVTVSDRPLSTATAETFGNIGLTLTPDAASTAFPGLTTVVRTTGTALTGAGSSASVKRWFRVTPTVDANLTMTLKMDLFEHERNGIVNGNLLLFSSPIPAGGGSPATTTWTPSAASAPVTPSNAAYATAIAISGLTHLSDWTLGNRANPLPVTLAAFTADRQGTNAALAWTTASEKSSRGFEVQASPDGRVFRVLDFVASSTPTSTSPRYYSYLDREAGKTGIRYYRLRQVDLNGTATFSSVRTVRFDGESVLRLTAAPNPFKERLTLTVELPVGAAAAPAQLSLTDAVGRTLLTQLTPALAAGLSQLELTDLAKLASGVYFVNLTVPGQTIQHLKVVKE